MVEQRLSHCVELSNIGNRLPVAAILPTGQERRGGFDKVRVGQVDVVSDVSSQ
jgi:hypothetical protein